MDRREFLRRMGGGAIVALFGGSLAGCSLGLQQPLSIKENAGMGLEAADADDLLMIIRNSEYYKKIAKRLRSESPQYVSYSHDAPESRSWATVIFTLD